MRKEHAVLDGETRAAAYSRGRTDEVAEAVDRAQGRVVEGTCIEAARQVGRMVLDIVHAGGDMGFVNRQGLGARSREVMHRDGICRPVADERDARTMAQGKDALSPEVGLWVARYGEGIDVAGVRTRHREARPDGVARKPGVMLDAPETFLFHGGDELAVPQERRRNVTVIRVDAEDEHLAG